jgi:hypothetical protein
MSIVSSQPWSRALESTIHCPLGRGGMRPETQMAESICNAGAVISLRDLPVRAGFRPPRERVASQRLLVGLAAWLCGCAPGDIGNQGPLLSIWGVCELQPIKSTCIDMAGRERSGEGGWGCWYVYSVACDITELRLSVPYINLTLHFTPLCFSPLVNPGPSIHRTTTSKTNDLIRTISQISTADTNP